MFLARKVAEIIPPLVFSDKAIQVLALYASFSGKEVLQEAPVPVERLRMYLPTHIFARVMVNPLMWVSVARKNTIPFEAVSVDLATAFHCLEDPRSCRPDFGVRNQPGSYLLLCTRHNAENSLFACSSAALRALLANVDALVLPRSAKVGLIRFTDAGERFRNVGTHTGANDGGAETSGLCRHMTFRFNGIGAHISHECVNDVKPMTSSDSKSMNGIKDVRRPFATALHTFPVVPSNEPKELMSAIRTRAICGHDSGGKTLVMPPLCRKYRFVKSQRAENWWQILGITLGIPH